MYDYNFAIITFLMMIIPTLGHANTLLPITRDPNEAIAIRYDIRPTSDGSGNWNIPSPPNRIDGAGEYIPGHSTGGTAYVDSTNYDYNIGQYVRTSTLITVPSSDGSTCTQYADNTVFDFNIGQHVRQSVCVATSASTLAPSNSTVVVNSTEYDFNIGQYVTREVRVNVPQETPGSYGPVCNPDTRDKPGINGTNFLFYGIEGWTSFPKFSVSARGARLLSGCDRYLNSLPGRNGRAYYIPGSLLAAFQPDDMLRLLSLKELISSGVTMKFNYFTEKKGVANLVGPSTLDDTYYELTQATQKNVRVVWDALLDESFDSGLWEVKYREEKWNLTHKSQLGKTSVIYEVSETSEQVIIRVTSALNSSLFNKLVNKQIELTNRGNEHYVKLDLSGAAIGGFNFTRVMHVNIFKFTTKGNRRNFGNAFNFNVPESSGGVIYEGNNILIRIPSDFGIRLDWGYDPYLSFLKRAKRKKNRPEVQLTLTLADRNSDKELVVELSKTTPKITVE